MSINGSPMSFGSGNTVQAFIGAVTVPITVKVTCTPYLQIGFVSRFNNGGNVVQLSFKNVHPIANISSVMLTGLRTSSATITPVAGSTPVTVNGLAAKAANQTSNLTRTFTPGTGPFNLTPTNSFMAPSGSIVTGSQTIPIP